MKSLAWISWLFFALAAAAAEQDPSVLHLRELQGKYREKLQSAEKKIGEQLNGSRRFQVDSEKPNLARYYIEDLEGQLKSLSQEFQETRLRVEVLDRILFTVERHYQGGPFRQFLETQLLHLAQRELLSPQADPRIWKFLLYQSIAIREIAPRQVEIAKFFDLYMNYSSVSLPKTPQRFLEESHYSNGTLVESVGQSDKTLN